MDDVAAGAPRHHAERGAAVSCGVHLCWLAPCRPGLRRAGREAARTLELARHLGVLLGTCAAAFAQPTEAPPGVAVSLQAPAVCDVGARCAVSVEIACPAGSRCTLETPGRLGALEVLQVADARPSMAGGQAWRIVVIAFEPGAVGVPPVSVRMVRERDGRASVASTPPATIDARLPDASPDDQLRDAAGPIDPGLDWRVVAGWAGAAAASLAVLEALRRWRRRTRVGAPPAASKPTLDQVIQKIRAIGRAPASSSDDILAVYRQLSDELRRFAGIALAVPAEAFSSQELLRTIAATPRGATHAPRDRDLLERIDRVKFGGERPDQASRADAISRAVDFVSAIGAARAAASPKATDVA